MAVNISNFRIMLKVKGDKTSSELDQNLYRYLLKRNELLGRDEIFEAEQLSEIDEKVEAMLNGTDTDFYTKDKAFSKDDFIIVRHTNYGINTDLYEQ